MNNTTDIVDLDFQLSTIYNIIMDIPNEILDIFKDFYGEDKVDMQNYPSFDEFIEWLKNLSLASYIPKSKIENQKLWEEIKSKSLSSIDEKLLSTIIPVIHSEEVREYIIENKFNCINILVYYPKVRVTNEYDKYVDITDLYAKVSFNVDGTIIGKFSLNRASYTYTQFISGYMHSHISSIPTSDFTKFKIPCTGRGPINDTILNLSREYDEDLWKLFCLELDKFVHTESIAGVPYNRLENIGKSERGLDYNFNISYNRDNLIVWRDINIGSFIENFIKSKKLKFNYKNGEYSIGMSYVDFVILISNEFITWYNTQYNKGIVYKNYEYLLDNSILKKCQIVDNKIYYNRSGFSMDVHQFIGSYICHFKGTPINLDITGNPNDEEIPTSTILNTKYVRYILTVILNVLNYNYGREENRSSSDNTSSKTVRYF